MSSNWSMAVLKRDGTVSFKGRHVGAWWVDGNDLYCYAVTEPNPKHRDSGHGAVCVSTHKKWLQEKVTEYLENFSDLRPESNRSKTVKESAIR